MRVARPGLPKKYAKMGFKKGWRAFKAAKRKRGTRKGQRRKTARRAFTRSNPRKTTMRRKKTFQIPLVQTVAGLALLGIASTGITQTAALEKPVSALKKAGENLIKDKDQAIKIGLGSLVAQFVATEVLRKRTVGSIGPIKLKVA